MANFTIFNIFLFNFLVLFGGGDVIAQVVVGKDQFNYGRLGRAWIFGTFILGPLSHLHYNFLEWIVVRKVSLCRKLSVFYIYFDCSVCTARKQYVNGKDVY